jgi:hypothetical protein
MGAPGTVKEGVDEFKSHPAVLVATMINDPD